MFRKSHKTETFIGKKTFLEGNLKTEGIIRIDGRVDGSIEADWVIIGSEGYCKGQIVSKKTLIKGKVEGTIEAQELIEIQSGGIAVGDIVTPKISINEGKFLGKSLIPEDRGEEEETETDTLDDEQSTS